jgi:hypothetical protein
VLSFGDKFIILPSEGRNPQLGVNTTHSRNAV